MKARRLRVTLGIVMLFQCADIAHSFPNLIVDTSGEVVVAAERRYYQDVAITGGGIVTYHAAPREEHIIGMICDTLLLDASSSILFGYTCCPPMDVVPFSTNTAGTPDVIVKEYGVTEGNGAGTYGGRGFNHFGSAKEPYGSSSSFDISRGSMGTDGESIRIWEPGSGWYTWEGRAGGGAGGAILIIGNEVTIEGTVNVNGWSGHDYIACAIPYPGYSGSGGGILIAAKNLSITSTARVTANGGEYAITEPCDTPSIPYHYHAQLIGKRDGGGGRIKIFYEQGTISPEAVIEAKGWEDGTVHIQQVRSIDQLLNPGDLNGDGKIDQEDLFLFQQGWHKTATPVPTPEETPTPTATPEP